MTTPQPVSDDDLLKMMDADIAIMVLVQGTLTDNTHRYAYVSILPSRYRAFKQAEAKGHYNLAEFGNILTHGPGKTPPMSVQKQMEEEYGANHCFEEQLNEWMEALKHMPVASTGEA